MRDLRIILGDQLSLDVSALRDLDAERDTVLMMEVHEEGVYVRHHKQKIVLVLSAMRHFARTLRARRGGGGATAAARSLSFSS
jgi:deoxyribodipyrimidine photolyase-related protein